MTDEFEPACRRMEWLDPFYKAVWEKAFAEEIPISGTFELTPRCNFNCKMCYVHLQEQDIASHGQEMPADEWLRIAREAKEAGTTWICITGGEPLLHPEFPRIWCELSQMGFFLTLQTNGALISGDMAKLLEEYPPRRVKITLYGTNDEVYEAVCGVKNGFTRVNDGIHTLMSLGIPVTLVSTIIQQNAEDVQNMAEYAWRHRLPWTSTIGIKTSLRGDETDMKTLRLQQPTEKLMQEEIQKRLREGKLIDPARKPCTYCKDYRLGYWVLWDGSMGFCSFLENPRIPVRERPFRQAWQQLLEKEESLQWPAACQRCEAAPVCMKCAASLELEEGEPVRVRGVPCEQMRNYYKKYQNQ